MKSTSYWCLFSLLSWHVLRHYHSESVREVYTPLFEMCAEGFPTKNFYRIVLRLSMMIQ